MDVDGLLDCAEVNDRINSCLRSYLVQSGVIPYDGSGKMFRCLSATHEDVHPSMHCIPGKNLVKCFGCGAVMNLVQVLGAAAGIDPGDYGACFREAVRRMGYVHVGGGRYAAGSAALSIPLRRKRQKEESVPTITSCGDENAFYERFFRRCKLCAVRRGSSGYWASRGFDSRDVGTFGLGELSPEAISTINDEDRRVDRMSTFVFLHCGWLRNSISSGYAVIPYDATHFVLRCCDRNSPVRYVRQAGFGFMIYGVAMLYAAAREWASGKDLRDGCIGCTVLVVEGEIDAMTIVSKAGIRCVAIGGKSQAGNFVDFILTDSCLARCLGDRQRGFPILFLPDNDGRGFCGEFIAAVKRLVDAGYFSVVLDNSSWRYKDANEYYCEDASGFVSTMRLFVGSCFGFKKV